MVVTPPAAAERVDQMKSSWFFWLREWTCASMAPGRISASPSSCRSRAGGCRALAHMRDLAVAHRDEAALDHPGRQHHGAGKDEIEIGHASI